MSKLRKSIAACVCLIVAFGCTSDHDPPGGTTSTEFDTAAERDVAAERDTAAGQDATGEQPALTFETYSNERFGFRVAYPAGVFTSFDRSQNGDGAVLSSSSGKITLRAFASENVQGQTVSDVLEEARDDFAQVQSGQGRQTVTVLRGTGTDGDRLVERIILTDENVYRLELSFPEGALDPGTVERIVSSFDVSPTN